MQKYILLLFLFVLPTRYLESILDGRNTPIIVDYDYTFTDFEWARGAVYFTQGFSVPENTTAILGLTAPVSGVITCCYAGDASTPSTIILEKPLEVRNNYINGGCTIKTADGEEGFISGLNLLSDRLIFNNDITLDFAGGTYDLSFATGGPFQRKCLMIDSPTPKTVRLRNGVFSATFVEDEVSERFIGGDTTGRHEFIFENMKLFMQQDIDLTFTNVDVTIGKGVTQICTADTKVNFYGALTIADDGVLSAVPGVEFVITSSILENNYFNMESRSKLRLHSNSLTFNRPLRIPSSLPAQNTYPQIVIGGASSFKATGLGSNAVIQLGANPAMTYTYDACLEILPAASVLLDQVTLQNKNFLL